MVLQLARRLRPWCRRPYDWLFALYFRSPPSGGWVTALAAERTAEYGPAGGNADRIGLAYAHARGYTGINKDTANPVIVSTVGKEVDRTHPDLIGQLVQGYGFTADRDANTVVYNNPNAGTCSGTGNVIVGNDGHIYGCGTADTVGAAEFLRIARKQATHIAAVIAGKSGNGDNTIQGIAYGAKIKPIGIYAPSNVSVVDTEERTALIAQASGAGIAVMNNNWHTFIKFKTFTETDGLNCSALPEGCYRYFIPSKFYNYRTCFK